ncbi:MAG: ATP-binding protein [Rikenellaceae bacterium]
MLTSEDIKLLVKGGEGYNVDFKLRVPSKVRELSQEVCAFVNSEGGYLLIGVDDTINEGVNEGVNKGVKSLLDYIATNVGLRSSQLSTAIGKSQKTVERYLKELKELDKIEFIGAPKTGGYFIKK